MTDDEAEGVSDLVAAQLEAQGVGCVRVSDGQVFVFTARVLEELLAKALENDGMAMVFVKRGAEA